MKPRNYKDSKTVRTFSPMEREKLKIPCRELGIDMSKYSSDAALEDAITAAILAEVAASLNPGAGFYDI
jgi:hypothetical protein